jgi:hypothetical protein
MASKNAMMSNTTAKRDISKTRNSIIYISETIKAILNRSDLKFVNKKIHATTSIAIASQKTLSVTKEP